MGQPIECTSADHLAKDGDVISLGTLRFKVLETPGHTPGGLSLYGEGVVFSGDTLFRYSVGRTDLYGGSSDILLDSIEKKLLTFRTIRSSCPATARRRRLATNGWAIPSWMELVSMITYKEAEFWMRVTLAVLALALFLTVHASTGRPLYPSF